MHSACARPCGRIVHRCVLLKRGFGAGKLNRLDEVRRRSEGPKWEEKNCRPELPPDGSWGKCRSASIRTALCRGALNCEPPTSQHYWLARTSMETACSEPSVDLEAATFTMSPTWMSANVIGFPPFMIDVLAVVAIFFPSTVRPASVFALTFP